MGLTLRCERGSIVIGWFTKVVVVLAVLAVVLFDGISIGLAHMNESSDAQAAAAAASDTWMSTHDPSQALASASSYANQRGETVIASTFQVAADGTVTLTLREQVKTMVVRYLGPLKKLALVRAVGQAKWVGP